MELGGVPQTIDEYFHLGPVFYVCSSARNWVSFMYKGYIIYVIPFGEQQPWMSEVPKLQRFNKKQVTCIKKMSFSGSPKGTPQDWYRRTMKKNYFAMKTNGIGW